MPSVSLVMPAYNEERTLQEAATECLDVLRRCTGDYELIILDDASTDRTPEEMRAFQARDPDHIRLHFHTQNQGIARTFEELYRLGTKDFVFLIPGDGQYPASALEQCMPLLAESDIVICYRTCKYYTFYRHLISAGYRWMTALLFGIDLYDAGSVKCVRRSLIDEIPIESKSVYLEAERMIRAARRGYRIRRVDITPRPRRAGLAGGARFSLVLPAILDMLRLWWELVILRRPA